MFGVSVTLGGDSWGVGDFKGTWACEPSKYAKWTKADQIKRYGEMVQWLHDLMVAANVNTLYGLQDVPVEIEMEDNMLKSWRILTEVIR